MKPKNPSRLQITDLWSDCRGYIDPGSGSYLLQVAVAGLLGAAFAVKSFWINIKTTFRDKFSRRR
jgi:hypothetical protein